MARFFNKRIFLIIISILIIAALFYFILPLAVPLIIAFITALLLEPLVKLLQKRLNIKRNLSVLIVFLLLLLILAITSYFTVTKVVTEVIKFTENAPAYINELSDAWLSIQERVISASKDLPKEFVHSMNGQIQSFLANVKNDLLAIISIDNIKSIITYIPTFLVNVLVYLIALFLFMLDMPRVKNSIFSHLKDSTKEKVEFMISRLSNVVFGFMKAQVLVSIIIFIVSLIGLLIITPEVAIVMSIIIWIIDVIPIIGSIVILGPWFVFHFATGNIILGTKLAILAAILLIIRRTVEPKVMGSHIGLSPLATLIAMFLGLQIFGILGFFIGPLILILFNSAKEAGIIKMNFKI